MGIRSQHEPYIVVAWHLSTRCLKHESFRAGYKLYGSGMGSHLELDIANPGYPGISYFKDTFQTGSRNSVGP